MAVPGGAMHRKTAAARQADRGVRRRASKAATRPCRRNRRSASAAATTATTTATRTPCRSSRHTASWPPSMSSPVASGRRARPARQGARHQARHDVGRNAARAARLVELAHGRPAARADADEHVADLRHRRVRDHALDVPLDERDHPRHEQRDRPQDRRQVLDVGGCLEDRARADEEIDADLLDLIAPAVAQTYLLVHDDLTGKSRIDVGSYLDVNAPAGAPSAGGEV